MESVNQINLNIDILILGAGPGGLGCFYGLNESDFEGSVLLLEMGKPLIGIKKNNFFLNFKIKIINKFSKK